MRTYGIPPSCLPIPDTGENKPPLMYQHMIWYQNREKMDRDKDGKVQLCVSSIQKQAKSTKQEAMTTAAIIPDDDDEFSLLDNPLIEDDPSQQQQQQEGESSRVGNAPSPHLIPPGSRSPLHESLEANTVITPKRTDVLFGPKYKHHPGTLKLQELVAQQSPIFESIFHRADKTEFVGSLVQHLKSKGIRFLNMDKETNNWVEVDDKLARNKVAKVFRNKRRTTGVGPSTMPLLEPMSFDFP